MGKPEKGTGVVKVENTCPCGKTTLEASAPFKIGDQKLLRDPFVFECKSCGFYCAAEVKIHTPKEVEVRVDKEKPMEEGQIVDLTCQGCGAGLVQVSFEDAYEWELDIKYQCVKCGRRHHAKLEGHGKS